MLAFLGPPIVNPALTAHRMPVAVAFTIEVLAIFLKLSRNSNAIVLVH